MNNEIISEYYLERYVLEELPDEYAEEIRRQVTSDPELRAALKNIESSNRDILALYPPPTVKANLLARLNEAQRKTVSFPFRWILTISSAFAVVLLFLFLILPALKEKAGLEPFDSGQDLSLVKGIPKVDLSRTQLLIYRKVNDQVEILTDGKRAVTGDLLQLAYVAAKESYGMILSIDGRGGITLHFPDERGGSTKLDQNKKSLLPHAIELDDAPGFERFFFITSESRIDVEDVLKRAESLAKDPEWVKRAALDLSEGLNQYSVLILKGEGP